MRCSRKPGSAGTCLRLTNYRTEVMSFDLLADDETRAGTAW